jgi:hypothetical protein
MTSISAFEGRKIWPSTQGTWYTVFCIYKLISIQLGLFGLRSLSYILKVSYRHQCKEDSSDAEYKLKIILERNDSVNINLHITSNCETTMK